MSGLEPQTFWQRCVSHFTAASPIQAQVPLPIEKLSCQIKANKTDYRPIVLVCCGSFNPPTYMHLRLFELAKDHLKEKGYDVWGGYMSPVNDKYQKPGLASAAERIAMSQAAARASDMVMVDAWEAAQSEYQRSLHVLRSIQHRLQRAIEPETGPPKPPSPTQIDLPQGKLQTKLLCGSDLVESFLRPGVWNPDQLKSILEEHGVVCISRDASSLEAVLGQNQQLAPYKQHIIWVQEPISNSISSSKLRELIRLGKSAKYLTPEPVLSYIRDHGLYQKS